MTAASTDFASEIVRFSRTLRAAGIPVCVDQSENFARATGIVDPLSRAQLHRAARATLVNRREDLALFDQLFSQFWHATAAPSPRGQPAPRAPRHDPGACLRPALATFVAQASRPDDVDIELRDRRGTYSDAEVFRTKDFSRMTGDELAQVQRAIGSMRWQAALRLTRRRVPDSRGDQLDVRRMLRRAARTGGACTTIPHLRRKVKPRPLVLMADISGSMELYCRILLQFFHSVTHSFDHVETFAFGTRLTRLTAGLELCHIEHALQHASERVMDWSGGTRIGDSLSEFNRVYGRRALRRGAVVLIVSDGWDRGNVERLRREMRFLHGRSHRVIWLNPLLGARTYEPRVRGMSAVLDYIDDFMPIHNLQSITSLAEHLTRLPKRKTGWMP